MTNMSPRKFVKWLKDEEYIYPDLKEDEIDDILIKLINMLSNRVETSTIHKTYVRRYLQLKKVEQQSAREFCYDHGIQERALYRWIAKYNKDYKKPKRSVYNDMCAKILSALSDDWKSTWEVAKIIDRNPTTAATLLKRMYADKLLITKYGAYTGKYRRVWYRALHEQQT